MKLGFNAWATNRCGHAQFAHKCQSSSWTRSPALWQRPHKYHTLLLIGTMHRGLKFRHRNTSDSICLTHVTKTESLTSCLLTLNQCWYWIPVKAAAANHWQNLIQVYLVIFPWFFASIMLLNGFFYCLFFSDWESARVFHFENWHSLIFWVLFRCSSTPGENIW